MSESCCYSYALCSRCGLRTNHLILHQMFGCEMIFLGVYCFTEVIVNNPSAQLVLFFFLVALSPTLAAAPSFFLHLSECFSSSSLGFSLSVFEGMWFESHLTCTFLICKIMTDTLNVWVGSQINAFCVRFARRWTKQTWWFTAISAVSVQKQTLNILYNRM